MLVVPGTFEENTVSLVPYPWGGLGYQVVGYVGVGYPRG